MKIESVPLSKLTLDKNNARKHSAKNLKAIQGSLKKFGQQKPVVVTPSGVVIAGNGTVEAARALGWSAINVVRTALEGYDLEAFALADNRTSELAAWDLSVLGDQLQGLFEGGFDIEDLGFSLSEFAGGAGGAGGRQGLTDPDALPEETKARVKPGDLWRLGSHRLLCGDATKWRDVKTLLGGSEADMVWTDPPYNVAYTGKTSKALTIQNDSMTGDVFRRFLLDAFTNCLAGTKKGGAVYVAHADSEGYNFRGALVDSGWLLKQCLVWVKHCLVMGRQDYHWKHEPILYGWKEGAAHAWHSDRKQTTVLEFDKPSRSGEHPTMKPVALVEYCVRNSTLVGESVLDVFGGSGTTLIAAEASERKAFLMELDPKYCDVILTRWEAFTGEKAVKL